MVWELPYGDGDWVRIDLPREAVVDCSAPRGNALRDPVGAVLAAVEQPLNFPPLSQATVPGDRIVLALDRGIPLAAAAVAGVVQSLLRGHAIARDIVVVVADEEERRLEPTRLLPSAVREAIEVVVHDPRQAAGLAYLAASRDGKPIYFNRLIDEADVVIPIGQLRLDAAFGYVGVHGCLYPRFSDAATQERFRRSVADWSRQQRVRREEAEEAAWLLGVQFTVQVAPGPRNSLLHVLAGECHAVADEGRRLCEAAWLHRTPARASLVVAGIDGGRTEQTWENVARALDAAAQGVADGGTIVLCTRLQTDPGLSASDASAPERLASQSPEDTADEISARRLAARMLQRAQERAHVYLLSDLDGDLVEEMGLAHVSAPEEVTRLCRRFQSCLLLGSAQYAHVTPGESG